VGEEARFHFLLFTLRACFIAPFLIGHTLVRGVLSMFYDGLSTRPNFLFLTPGRAKMSGFMEILLIVAIIVGIIFLPGMMNRKSERVSQRVNHVLRISGWMRLAILASFLWPAFVALYLKPWNSHWHVFLYAAVGPVALTWGIFWVLSGFKKRGK